MGDPQNRRHPPGRRAHRGSLNPLPLKLKESPDDDAKIVRAACYDADQVFVGWRHSFILKDYFIPAKRYMSQDCQGFVDQHGFFWNRQQAADIAWKAKQTYKHVRTLFSEDLWDNDGKPRDGGPYDPMAG